MYVRHPVSPAPLRSLGCSVTPKAITAVLCPNKQFSTPTSAQGPATRPASPVSVL